MAGGLDTRRGLVGAALMLGVLSLVGAARAAGGDLPNDVAQAYAPAVDKLRDFYTHVTVTGRLKRELPQTKKSVEQSFVYRAAGMQVRLNVTTTGSKGMKAKVGASDLFMATRDGSLTTVRNPGSEVFDDAKQLNYGDTKTRIDSTCLLTYPYTFGSYATIYEYLRQPTVTVLSVKKIKRDDESFVKISFNDITGRQDRTTKWSSWFLLSPAEGWAVREFSRSTGQGDAAVTYRGSLTYNGQDKGVPLASRILSIKEQGPQHVCVERETVWLEKFTAGAPGPEFFTGFEF
jgi:hypothetical protein